MWQQPGVAEFVEEVEFRSTPYEDRMSLGRIRAVAAEADVLRLLEHLIPPLDRLSFLDVRDRDRFCEAVISRSCLCLHC